MSDRQEAKFWKSVALGLLRARKNEDEVLWNRQEGRASVALSRAGQRRREARLNAARARLYGSRVPGKRAPEDARQDGRCAGCLRLGADLAGAYCPTCRQRGAKHGWCECGAALYSDKRCRREAIHRAYERSLSLGDRKNGDE